MQNRLFKDESDVIVAKISDHHPVIHDGVLFWNIMMQGRMRQSDKRVNFNNAFGFTEDDRQYELRLTKVAGVIAKIILKNPDIETITLCEGPIKPLHLKVLIETLISFPCMHRFMQNIFNQDMKSYQNWGLLMLTDKDNQVAPVRSQFSEQPIAYAGLANRIQLWKLTSNGKNKYIALAHFPFAGDEHITDKFKLSKSGKVYCKLIMDLMTHYANEHLIICADFNLNPYLIGEWKNHVMDKIPYKNSILLTGNIIQAVTVDGILLSQKEKQKYYFRLPIHNLFGKLAQEYRLFKSYIDKCLEDHKDEKHFALAKCMPS